MDDRYLFKAKRADNGEWVEGYLIEQDVPEYHAYIVRSIKIEMDEKHIDILEHDIYEVEPETICRYTGLTDKNGNKIWENGIVKFPDCEMSTESGYGDCFVNVGKIAYDIDSMSYFITNRVTVDMCDICIKDEVEVIGSIFDHPELLEV